MQRTSGTNQVVADQEQDYQRAKRSQKKMNAQRQIKTKHAKSIKIKSHNKHLYIHHRLAKKVLLDPPSEHYIPSSEPTPLYSPEALRSIIYQHRHPYYSSYLYPSTPSRKARQSKISPESYIDESQLNYASHQYREYTLNEFNIPDEPSYDDTMINFLLEMQNRDLYVLSFFFAHHHSFFVTLVLPKITKCCYDWMNESNAKL